MDFVGDKIHFEIMPSNKPLTSSKPGACSWGRGPHCSSRIASCHTRGARERSPSLRGAGSGMKSSALKCRILLQLIFLPPIPIRSILINYVHNTLADCSFCSWRFWIFVVSRVQKKGSWLQFPPPCVNHGEYRFFTSQLTNGIVLDHVSANCPWQSSKKMVFGLTCPTIFWPVTHSPNPPSSKTCFWVCCWRPPGGGSLFFWFFFLDRREPTQKKHYFLCSKHTHFFPGASHSWQSGNVQVVLKSRFVNLFWVSRIPQKSTKILFYVYYFFSLWYYI